MAALPDPLWRPFPGLSDYAGTVAAMEAHVERMAAGVAAEEIWLGQKFSGAFIASLTERIAAGETEK